MASRFFNCDSDLKEVKVSVYNYPGINKELSSEDAITKEIVNYTLKKLYGEDIMWRQSETDINATSKCDSEDVYDEDAGKDICSIKADLKYHQKMYTRYLKVAWLLKKISNRLMKYVEVHQKKIERLERDLENYKK